MASFIWLAYRDPEFDSGAFVARRFRARTDYEIPVTEKPSARTLTGRLRVHVTARWKTWRIAIGASQLVKADDREFIRKFWESFEQFLSFDASGTAPAEGAFTPITTGDGEAPVDFLQGVKEFQSWSFTCTELDGSLS